ncbi:hypothetical protein D3C76_1649790 [compost metagenome]
MYRFVVVEFPELSQMHRGACFHQKYVALVPITSRKLATKKSQMRKSEYVLRVMDDQENAALQH